MLSRRALAIAALAFSTVTAPVAAYAQEKVVNVYNWNDYIDPKVLEDFTKETGIKVVYDTYDNNEIVETKMLAGKSGYDIVVPSAPFLQRMVAAGVFQPLDLSKLPNHKNLWPEIMDRLKLYDPGNRHAVPYLWGTIGLGVNVAKVKERLGGDIPRSWNLLLDPKNAAKLKDCGIHVLDGPEDVLPNMLRAIKLDPNSKKVEDIQKLATRSSKCATTSASSIRPSNQRARGRRHLHGARLLRRHPAGPQARGGGEERRRDRLYHPLRGRADVVRLDGDPEGCAERRQRPQADRLPAPPRRGRSQLEHGRVCERQPGGEGADQAGGS